MTPKQLREAANGPRLVLDSRYAFPGDICEKPGYVVISEVSAVIGSTLSTDPILRTLPRNVRA